VHWCISDQTALGEAEVEYEDRTDESIGSKLPLTQPVAGHAAVCCQG